ncbi:ABC transporter ATP-binding protein [Rhizobium sp. FKL33]|jgi:branched-chain amino acid transport system ATP-binding protein|uniref:ABC transporter ATP-binding protein n=1 Tax=Rhizobium sp. FKL33 TaxID=2562307 RepID=UPI0010BFA3A8|nr:ABC transporter ATP-binding protein [Rhizobium sp. FKL33]
MMLKIENFDCFYGESQALRGFSIHVAPGQVVCLLGRNGAGKTTALKSIMGIIRPAAGRMELNGVDLTNVAPRFIPRHGIGYVPQGRRLFTEMTVRENLKIGLMTRNSGPSALERALSYFPVLRERMDQRSGTLSGGEQTMLAIARALCIEPTILMLDEPTEGLMPSMIAAIRDVVIRLRDEGVGVLLVEQRIDAVMPVADRIAFMDHGAVKSEFEIDAVRADTSILKKYLGVGH